MNGNNDLNESMLTVQQVAKRLNVSARLVYKLAASGALKVYRIGGAIRVTAAQLAEYLKRCEISKPEPLQQRRFRHLDL